MRRVPRRGILGAAEATLEQLFFDDFACGSLAEIEAHGWVVRTRPGWPGIAGAVWARDGVCLVDDPDRPGNRLLRLCAGVGGRAAAGGGVGAAPPAVRQAQVCHRRKYLAGTYAARVRFSDQPAAGPAGDQVVQSFYTITPYAKPMDPAYSEMDFEYLPGGGWGLPPGTLVTTTWDTVQIEPWQPVNASDRVSAVLGGWHVLVIQVDAGQVRYLVDGTALASHREPYYPVSPMSLNFNLWFIEGGLIGGGLVGGGGQAGAAGQAGSAQPVGPPRTWHEEIDWVFHARERVLSGEQVLEQVEDLRSRGTSFTDTVPELDPPLQSPCDL